MRSPGAAADRRNQRHAARRHVDDLAGKLAAVGQHVAAEQVDLDALVAAAVLGSAARKLAFRSTKAMQSHACHPSGQTYARDINASLAAIRKRLS